MAQVPTAEQHRALLNDCRELAGALPASGVLDRGRRPYRAIRFERKLDAVEHDPAGLLEYIRGMARRTSEGLEALVEYNRLDLSVETLIIDQSKVYAPLFTPEDRAAAQAKIARQAGEVVQVARDREQQLRAEEAARQARIAAVRARLPQEIDQLKKLAAESSDPEEAIAINTSILGQVSRDVVALNRLGRAFEALGSIDQARWSFQQAIEIDPSNQIASRRLADLNRQTP
jgi:tetratricopeptide (TPR) repeat protein